MDFIMDNYLWIGIIGVVLLMALIGFLAEKTNFITNSSAKPKKEKKNKSEKKGKDESTTIDMSFTPETTESGIESSFNTPVEVVKNFDNEPAEILEIVAADSTEPIIDSAPIADTAWKVEEKELVADETPVTTVTNSGEDLTVPFGDSPKVADNLEIKKEDTTTVVEDEDIWKF